MAKRLFSRRLHMDRKFFCLLVLVVSLAGTGACQASLPSGGELKEAEYHCSIPGTTLPVTIESQNLGYEYRFKIHLPPCYESLPERSFPVLYLIPGASSNYDTWLNAGAAQVAEEMILSQQIPPFLIIAVDNISADSFGRVIIEDLIPYVENQYRVRDERIYHAIAGGSLGGIGAYRVAFSTLDYFSSAGMFGSGVIEGEQGLVREWLSAAEPENPLRIYLNCGYGDPLMLKQAQVMINLLDEAGVSHTEVFSEGGHNYAYWVSNLPDYYLWLTRGW